MLIVKKQNNNTMVTYIAFLRGINVGGLRKIKMDDLKKLFIDLKFSNVQTYIQSGNIVFTSSIKNQDDIRLQIENKILREFEFNVPVIIRSYENFKNIFEENPYIKNGSDTNIKNLHVTLLHENPNQSLLNKLETIDISEDEYKIVNNDIYLYCHNGYGKTKLTNGFFENKLKVPATTRNWNTITKLIELADNV